MDINEMLIAALLHDVGKPLQRSEIPKLQDTVGYSPQKAQRTTHLHVEWTYSFFQENCPELETACKLASSHHNTIAYAPESERWAAEIIQIADHVVSGHDRNKDPSKQDFKSNLLAPVFSKVQISKTPTTSSKTVPLIPLSAFIESMTKSEHLYEEREKTRKVDAYRELSEKFIKSFCDLYSQYQKGLNKPLFINSIEHLLEEYFWCVPANTQEENPVGSLFHHSRATAMIAAVLFQYYTGKEKDEIYSLKTDDTEKRFLLIGGNLSGIQNFIFDLNVEHARKTAKLLRARSFKVKMLSDMTMHYVLQHLNLVQQNVLMNAGGKFIIISPNTEEIKTKLAKLRVDVEQELFDQSQGGLSINLNWNTQISLADFKTNTKKNPDKQEPGKFHALIKKVFAELDLSKKHKFGEKLKKDSSWNSDCFIIRDAIYTGNICPICKRRAVDDGDECKSCTNEIELGKQLQHCKYGIIGSNLKNPLINMYNNSVQFALMKHLDLASCTENTNDYFALREDTSSFPLKANATSLPMWRDEYHHYMQKQTDESEFLSFNSISNLALVPQADGSTKGVPYLAVLKGDVDNLGLIFSMGIKSDYNITVWSTLSAQIDLFFSRFIPALIEIQFPEIYTIFTGGDDFVLVGPWNKMLEFTEYINNRFTSFVNNNEIHFSAGFSVFHSRDPVRYAVADAESMLKRSKQGDKNQITVFDTTADWKDFFTQLKTADKYDAWLKDGIFSMQTMYKLFEFNRMFQRYEETKDVRNLIYMSRLHYDFNRNIYLKRKISEADKQEVKNHEDGLCKRESKLMAQLKIALHKAVYNNR